MKKMITRSLLGLATIGLLLVAIESRATTVTYTATQPASTTEWDHQFILPEFNPALGTLNSAYVKATENITASGSVSNSAAIEETFSFSSGSKLTVTLPGGLGTLVPFPLAQTVNYDLLSGGSAAYGAFNASGHDDNTFFPTDTAVFIGVGNLDLDGSTQSYEVISGGGGNVAASVATTAGATVLVTYDYTPIPEPATCGLLVLGGLAWLLRKR